MIKWLVIAGIAIILLSYLGIDIKKTVQSPVTQSNVEYLKDVTVFVWNKYLKGPVVFIWQEVFIKYVWDPAMNKINNKVKGNGEKVSVNSEGRFFSAFSL